MDIKNLFTNPLPKVFTLDPPIDHREVKVVPYISPVNKSSTYNPYYQDSLEEVKPEN